MCLAARSTRQGIGLHTSALQSVLRMAAMLRTRYLAFGGTTQHRHRPGAAAKAQCTVSCSVLKPQLSLQQQLVLRAATGLGTAAAAEQPIGRVSRHALRCRCASSCKNLLLPWWIALDVC